MAKKEQPVKTLQEYVVPEYQVVVEAESAEEAGKLAKKKAEDNK